MNAPPLRYKTPFGGYAVKFSPFEDNRVAAATAQNYGIIGNGKQLVLEVTPTGLVPIAGLDTRDGLYDCAWSEENENVLASASGDGSIKVWDLKLPPNANPIRSLQEHRHEVYGLDWNSLKRSLLVSASWDDSVKLWDLNHPHSLRTFRNHTYCVYSAAWNPRHGDVFLSASGDCTVNIWDQRREASTLKLRCHDFEVLSADWCKYNDCVIATASVDKTLRVWDVRAPKQPLNTLLGHTYAVRRVQFSPYAETVLMSCSYDMTVRLWDFAAPGQPCLQVCDHHTEFAVGCHFSTLQEGLLASAGWDGDIVVWKSPLTRGRSPLPPPR